MKIQVQIMGTTVTEGDWTRPSNEVEICNEALAPYYSRCPSARIVEFNVVDKTASRWDRKYDVSIEIDDAEYAIWVELQEQSKKLFGDANE